MYGFFLLIFTLLILDTIECYDGALDRALLTKFINIFLSDQMFLVSEAGHFTFFGTVVELWAYHLEQLVGISVISLKLLTINCDTWMHVNIHVRSYFVVSIEEQLLVCVSGFIKQFHLCQVTCLIICNTVSWIHLRYFDSFIEAITCN